MHSSSMTRMQRFFEQFVDPAIEDILAPLTVCDVGSYDVNGCYKPIFTHPKIKYVGVDAQAGPNVDKVVDPDCLERWSELEPADVLISGQTLEHVDRPWMFIQRLNEIVKHDGMICLIVPSQGPYHAYPKDCWRILPQGLHALARSVLWEVVFCDWNYQGLGEPIRDSGWGDVVGIFIKRAGGFHG